MNKLDILRDAHEILRDPNRWTQGYAFRNEQGIGINCEPEVHPGFVPARFCALGALRWAARAEDGSYDWPVFLDARVALLHAVYPDADAELDPEDAEAAEVIGAVNDEPDGYTQIMAAFRQALAEHTPTETPRQREQVTA